MSAGEKKPAEVAQQRTTTLPTTIEEDLDQGLRGLDFCGINIFAIERSQLCDNF